MDDLLVFLKPLLLTILFEESAACFSGLRKKDLLLVFLVNLLSNPVLVLFSLYLMYYLGIGTGQLITYAVLEPLVVFVEYLYYRKYLKSQKNPLFLSLVLNLVSIAGGFLCQL